MKRLHRFLVVLALGLGLGAQGWTAPFKVLVYNVNHLFDIDGVSVYSDWGPDRYGPNKLLSKLRGITATVLSVDGGQGPEIILLQELEADQTPARMPFDPVEFLESTADWSLEQMLTEPLENLVRDFPAEAWLVKAFHEAGLATYEVCVGEYREDPTGRTIAHTNAVFTRYPVLVSRTHQTAGARGIQEVVVEVEGAPFYLFNNHWKSGAGDPKMEKIRLGNALVLRRRLDEILAADPLADILVGGDFNSQYDQGLRYPAMEQTAVHDVLGSQGNEAGLQTSGGPDLYNLWYELVRADRGSDIYRNEWGTLMQVMVTPGLYERRGIVYVDNSFRVLRLPGLNAEATTGVPIRWQTVGDGGYGFSDHLPLLVTFQGPMEQKTDWISLENPGTEDDAVLVRPAIIGDAVQRLDPRRTLRDPDALGRTWRVEVVVSGLDPLEVRRGEETIAVWIPNRTLRREVQAAWIPGETVAFVATVGTYRGAWQLTIESSEWLEPVD